MWVDLQVAQSGAVRRGSRGGHVGFRACLLRLDEEVLLVHRVRGVLDILPRRLKEVEALGMRQVQPVADGEEEQHAHDDHKPQPPQVGDDFAAAAARRRGEALISGRVAARAGCPDARLAVRLGDALLAG